jgi:DNA primase catalytic core
MFKKIRDLDTVRELVRQEAKLEDVASRMYGVELRASGSDDMKAKCPFHEEDTPSFGIRKSKQLFNCFGCKTGGDVFTFVQLMDNCDYIESIRKLAEFASFDLKPYQENYTEEEKKLQELYNINVDVMDYCRAQTTTENFNAWRRKRMFSSEVLELYGVGYNSSALSSESIPTAEPEQAQSLGLDRKGQWDSVIVVPLRDQYGRIAGFRNRMLDSESKIKVQGPRAEHPLTIPSIYGLYEARRHIRETGSLILVEGEPDVWRMASSGFKNVAALLGTKLEDSTIALLESLSINRVIVMADNDTEGRKFAQRVAEKRLSNKILVKIASLNGNGKDPDEIVLADGIEPIQQAINEAKYAFEFLIDRITERYNVERSTDKLDILNEAKHFFSAAGPTERELAARKLSSLLSLDYEIVSDFFRDSEKAQTELNNVHAERVVLKRMLTDEEFVGVGLLGLKKTDFYLSKHRLVFEAMGKLYRRQQSVNTDTVILTLENDKVDGARTLINGILSQNIDASSAGFLLEDLRDKALRRDMTRRALDAANRLSDTKSDAKHVIQTLSSELSTAIVGATNAIVHVSEVVFDRMRLMHDRIKAPNAIIGLDMGPDFPVLNHTLHGLQKKRYIVVAAPSGVGKTAFAGVLARRAAIELKQPTLYFTFETGTETLTDRLIASISGVETDKVITGYINKQEAELVHQAAEDIAASPLVMTERGIVFEECAAILRHDVLKRGTRLAIIDYMQLMNIANSTHVRRDQELGFISRGFLELSKELDMTIIVLAQMNRDSTKAGSNEGTGIGESWKIYQDTDGMLIFREKTKEEMAADGPDKGNRIMKLAKHRHGKTGVQVDMVADLTVMRMYEYNANRKRTH